METEIEKEIENVVQSACLKLLSLILGTILVTQLEIFVMSCKSASYT